MNELQTDNELIQKPQLGNYRTTPLSGGDADLLSASIFNGTTAGHLDPRASRKQPAPAAAAPAKPAPAAASTAVAAIATEPATAEHTAGPAATAAAPRKRCTYRDCLVGRASVPQDGLGKNVFQILMVGGMVTFMATINGVMHSGLGFFAHALWMYPLVFCLALLVRLFVGDKIVGFVAPRLIFPHIRHSLARNIAMTALNVGVMGVIMGAIITLLLSGFDNYFATLVPSLLATLPLSAVVNYFIVNPAVKMIYHNDIEPGDNAHLLSMARKYAMPWAAIFSN